MRPATRVTPLEALEDRTLLSSFALSGTTLNVDLAASESVQIVSNGTSYSLTSSGTWSGTDGTEVTGNGTSTLTVTTEGLAAINLINITDSGAGAAVTFNTSGANSFGDSLSVVLDDAAAGTITLNGATSFSGSAAVSLATSRNVVLNSGASLTTVNGNLTLEANQQAMPTSGAFVGINVNNAVIQATGAGVVSVTGKGGNSGAGQNGVFVQAGGQISGGTTGNSLIVNGTGGNGASTEPNPNAGVRIDGTSSQLTSAGGSVQVTGVGGSGTGVFNAGVNVSGGTLNTRGITTDASGTDIFANQLSLTARSTGIGTSTNPLRFAATSLTGNTGSGNGPQFLHEADTVSLLGGLDADTGTITLVGGTFSFSANDRIRGGKLTIGSAAVLDLNNFSDSSIGGSLALETGTSSGAQIVTGTGTVTINGDVTVTSTGTGATGASISGNLNLGGATRTFNIANGAAASDLTVAAVISNGGVTKTGAGTLTLGGNNSYTNATTVSVGTLALVNTGTNNNIASSPTINVASGATLDVTGLDTGVATDTLILASGQTLNGTGTITGATQAASGSFIAPGNRPGILNTGNIAFVSGSTFAVEIGGTTAGSANNNHDQLNVTGTVDLGGATLTTTAFNSFVPAATPSRSSTTTAVTPSSALSTDWRRARLSATSWEHRESTPSSATSAVRATMWSSPSIPSLRARHPLLVRLQQRRRRTPTHWSSWRPSANT